MTTITRIFDSSSKASEAAAELKTNNFPGIRLASQPAANGKGGGDPQGALQSAGFSQVEAEAFAGSLKNGGAVLSVETPFGRGKLAEQIIARHGASQPAPTIRRRPTRSGAEGRSSDESDAKAAPLSSLLHLPVLTSPRPTTVGSLGDQRPTFPVGLLRSDFYVSRLFGLPLLTRSKAWASLIHDPAPLSRWLGMPVLLRGDKPASTVQDQPVAPATTSTP